MNKTHLKTLFKNKEARTLFGLKKTLFRNKYSYNELLKKSEVVHISGKKNVLYIILSTAIEITP